MADGGAYDVFISYARSDGDAAAELNGWLRANGFTTFFDRSELRPGLRWVPALEEAISRARAVAILVGRHGLGNTQQYERELALVRQTGEPAFPVIPVLMPGHDSPPIGFLQLLTWVDFSKGSNVIQQTDALEALRAALCGQPIAASEVRASICPYRGLEPFREEDAAFFCGRDDAIRELAALTRANSFVAVVGPSGSGKSSLVFAGLLPALRQERQTRTWDVVSLQPGQWPLRSLAAAFGNAPENAGPAEIDAYLEKEAGFYRGGDAEMLARIVNDRLDAAPEQEKQDHLLIYVDQWEELYAMAPPAEDKEGVEKHAADVEKFIALLVAASAKARASVVLTVRADFYNPLIRNPRLATLLPKQQVNIPPMSRDDLRLAIETPAKTAGLSFAPPQLIDRILYDVGLEEGRLPLLQFALKETWQEREGVKLTAEGYTAVGGVARAIRKTAEDEYGRLNTTQKEAARRLFLRLVTPGEGQADTRARSIIPDDPQQREIVAQFSNPKTRLLVTALQATGQAGGETRATVEVAHEALIQRWPTLQGWVNDNREKLRDRAALLRFKAEWEENGESQKFLLDPGVQLERGRALLSNPGDVPVDDIYEFINRSIDREKERGVAEKKAEEAKRRRLRNALLAVVVVAGISLYEYFDASHQLTRANQALAASINNDLGFEPNAALGARQRRALWKLATSAQAVKDEYLSILSENPEEDARVSPGFNQVLRAFGLNGPNSEQVKRLIGAARRQLNRSSKNAGYLLTEIRLLSKAPTYRQEARVNLDDLKTVLAQYNSGNHKNLFEDVITKIDAGQLNIMMIYVSMPNLGSAKDSYERQRLEDETREKSALIKLIEEDMANKALEEIISKVRTASNAKVLSILLPILGALVPVFSEEQTSHAIDSVIKQIGAVRAPNELWALAQSLETLSPSVTSAQAQLLLDPLMGQFEQSSDPYTLRSLALTVQALPVQLPVAQTAKAKEWLLPLLLETTNSESRQALIEAFQALAAKFEEAQANQSESHPVPDGNFAESLQTVRDMKDDLRKIYALQALAGTLADSGEDKSKLQIAQIYDLVSGQVERVIDPQQLRGLAITLVTLAPMLTEDVSQKAFDLAKRSLAWASSTDEAVAWAKALVALSSHTPDQNRILQLVSAVTYPTAGGPATEILLEELRTLRLDAPGKSEGTTATLESLVTNYPRILQQPTCPVPPQSYELSGLKCP